MAHFPQRIQTFAVDICPWLLLAKKWELRPSENLLHKHNEKLKQELNPCWISEKDTLMLWSCGMVSRGMLLHLGLSKLDWRKLVLQRICVSVGKDTSCLHQQVFSSSVSNLITQHRVTFEHVTGKEHFEPKPIVSQPPRALTHLQTIAKVEEFREQM